MTEKGELFIIHSSLVELFFELLDSGELEASYMGMAIYSSNRIPENQVWFVKDGKVVQVIEMKIKEDKRT